MYIIIIIAIIMFYHYYVIIIMFIIVAFIIITTVCGRTAVSRRCTGRLRGNSELGHNAIREAGRVWNAQQTQTPKERAAFVVVEPRFLSSFPWLAASGLFYLAGQFVCLFVSFSSQVQQSGRPVVCLKGSPLPGTLSTATNPCREKKGRDSRCCLYVTQFYTPKS